jgi:hypothetical protein
MTQNAPKSLTGGSIEIPVEVICFALQIFVFSCIICYNAGKYSK